MRIELPSDVEYIISELQKRGHEAYAVGGCVRDAVLGCEPHDWDITTSASPDQVKSVFLKTIDTGIEHGTVTVRRHGKSYEVTTFRIDGKYEDGRHPREVTFVGDLSEDLARRDFTINAMAYCHESGLVDKFGGRQDLEKGIIRCVGDPMLRFSEDALRMMRAVRFAASLGFDIESKTAKAIKKLAPTLDRISAERVRDELLKTITSPNPGMLKTMSDLGLTAVFLPEWDRMLSCEQNTPHHCYSVGEHTIRVMEEVRPEPVMRLAALLHDVGKPDRKTTDEEGCDHFKGHPQLGAEMSRDILRRLKLDNDTIARVRDLVLYHDYRPEATRRSVRRAISKTGTDMLGDLFELKRADVAGQSDYQRKEKLQAEADFERLADEIIKEGECTRISDLAIGGRELLDMGVPRGPEIGRILHELLERVLEEPSLNEKGKLTEMVKSLKSLVLIFVFLIPALIFSGCTEASDEGAASIRRPDIPTRSENAKGEEQENAEEDIDSVEEAPLFILEDINSKEETVTVQNVSSGQEFRYGYSLATLFISKFGDHAPMTDFKPGMIVELGDLLESGVLSEIRKTDRAWEYTDVSDFAFDTDHSLMRIFGESYKFESYVPVFSGSYRIEAADITESDLIRVSGIDKEILAVAVTTGHGYLSLTGTEIFENSLIQIGKKIATLITGEMVIEVPEGKYAVTVANNGYGGTKKVKIKRGKTTTLDLNELKGEGPKKCEVTFKVGAEGVSIYLDGKKVKPDKKLSVVYGRHLLRVEAEGYDVWERVLFVNSPEAEISLDPEEISTPSGSNNNSNNNNNNNNSRGDGSGTDDDEDEEDEGGTTQEQRDETTLDYLTTLSDSLINLVTS